MRRLDNPYARDLADDLEKLSEKMARRIDQARSAERP
jgi:hypothetical protein